MTLFYRNKNIYILNIARRVEGFKKGRNHVKQFKMRRGKSQITELM